MSRRDIVVVGGSAGAIEPLTRILRGLPRDFPAAVLVVVHTAPEGVGTLAEILDRSGLLRASFPADGDEIRSGTVYVAPPDRHLLVNDGRVSIYRGPRENGFRPAIDPLFRSAAHHFDGRVIGVILSGALDDGTFGLMAIKNSGGVAIVQHPTDSILPAMPLSAIQNVEVDHIVPAAEIAPLLIQLAQQQVTTIGASAEQPGADHERDEELSGVAPDELEMEQGPPSVYSCPECGGVLWELKEGSGFRFRCHTGHGFTPDVLLHEQTTHLENALWTAIRVLQERATLHRQMADRCSERGLNLAAARHEDQARDAQDKSAMLRNLIGSPPGRSALVQPDREPARAQTNLKTEKA